VTDTDSWRPGCDPAVLRARARMLRALREFMDQREVMEVETPLLTRAANYDLQVDNFRVEDSTAGTPLALHGSPELFMKRLVAAGSGPIWQLCKVFRQGEVGARHNPEFTMLEWYLPGEDAEGIAEATLALFTHIRRALKLPALPALHQCYADAFEAVTGLDPHHCQRDQLAVWAANAGLSVHRPESLDRDQWLDLIMSERVQAGFPESRFTVIHDFPASQAALARHRRDDRGRRVAARIEIYLGALELANGYHELTDPVEQRARFQAEADWRRQQGLPELLPDEKFMAALTHGLPDCAGLSVGIDRLLMTLTGKRDIRDVLSFDFSRL